MRPSAARRYRPLVLLCLLLTGSVLSAQTRANTLHGSFGFSTLTEDVGLDVDHQQRVYLTGLAYNLSPAWSVAAQATLVRSNTEDFPDDRQTTYQASVAVA